MTWGSGAHLAVELLNETPLVPVVVRCDPASCGPMWPTGPLPRRAPGPRPVGWWEKGGVVVNLREVLELVGEVARSSAVASSPPWVWLQHPWCG
jgi:hypothetical protein